MNRHELRPAKGSTKRRRRVARGIGSGMGKTATRGTKGQKARRQIKPWFEGGQTPIHRRLPVKKGFRNINHKEYAIVNVSALDKHFSAGNEVTEEALIKLGLIHPDMDGLKILGQGDLGKSLKVTAHLFSASAKAKIEKAGGTANQLPQPAKWTPKEKVKADNKQPKDKKVKKDK
ncbi:MAG: 50S ribosomal protein L15 [Fimbriimonadaceae bacterium]|nr:50S ribosomal protein L15 [Fimbriimonadaceae bacterium]QYK58270.1 MAG: 50S ribosomal protein L15 [Fimbriimonadaceae bacterium]